MQAAKTWFVIRVRALWLVAAAVVAGPALGAMPLPVEHFTNLPAIDSVAISPSGKRMAILMFGPSGYRRLGVMDLDPIGQARVVSEFSDADVSKVRWVNDDRLVFEAFQRDAVIREGGAGTFAVNHDGTQHRQLIAWSWSVGAEPGGKTIASKILPYGWFVHSTVDDGTDDVFVYRVVRDSIGDTKEVLPARLNTATGAVRTLSYGMPEGTTQWLLDANHEPRVLTTYLKGRDTVYWRRPGADTWTVVADFDPLTEQAFTPWLIDRNGRILVTARPTGDTEGLYVFDPVAKRLDPEPVASMAGFDLNPSAQVDGKSGTLVGLHFTADRPMSHWFDADLRRLQRSIDASMPPDRSNRLICGRCESTRFIVIRSSSDRQPGEYFLFDRSKSSLQRIGASRPWIDEASQGRRTFHRVSTRDGMQIPVYVTHPAGAAADAALPAVVLVHGGPWVRGTDLGWQVEAQFLASRGYRVIEPEFRGSEGYGFRHFKAGWKEWGRAMQDDLVDAVQWAAKQRLVDPARVCITGGSYGGYAALMGPIASPGTYRCAASFAGVTDIDLMYSITWSDFSQTMIKYSMPVVIGDRQKDAQRLAAASPLKRVAEIKVPVMLAHGGLDRRVPMEHALKFSEAARRAGVAIEQVDYRNEAHGFVDPADRADYYGRLERFFEKSLQSPR